VANNWVIFGYPCLYKACYKAPILFDLVSNKWNKAIMAPSNSVPYGVSIVIGENDFQRIFSQILVAINKEIPLPKPYPLLNSSSSIMTTTAANVN